MTIIKQNLVINGDKNEKLALIVAFIVPISNVKVAGMDDIENTKKQVQQTIHEMQQAFGKIIQGISLTLMYVVMFVL